MEVVGKKVHARRALGPQSDAVRGVCSGGKPSRTLSHEKEKDISVLYGGGFLDSSKHNIL